MDYYYKKYKLGPIDAIAKTMVRVRGSYALELMFKDYPGEIWVARKDSPMIVGISDGETYVASDVPAILKYTRNVYYIGNLEFARLLPGEAHFYDLNGDEVLNILVRQSRQSGLSRATIPDERTIRNVMPRKALYMSRHMVSLYA